MDEEQEENNNFPIDVSDVVKLIQERITNYTYKFTYDDTDENVDQDFYLKFNCIQGWFIRCSFKTKVDFLKNCASQVNDINLLITIINTLYTISTKDRIYSLARGNFQAADLKLNAEDNRCLHKATLQKVMNNQINWFKTLNNIKQYFFLIKLITLADGIVIMNNIFAHFIEVLLSRSRRPKSSISLRRRTTRIMTASFIPEQKEESLQQMIEFCFRKIVPLKSTEIVSNNELNSLLMKWRQFMFKHAEQSVTSEVEEGGEDNVSTKPINNKNDEIMDIIQAHPVWVTLSLLKNLESIQALSKLNEYWAVFAKEYKGELGARKQLNKEIASLEEQIQTISYNKKVIPEPPVLRDRISIITKPSFRNKFKTKNMVFHNSLICEVYKDYLVDFNLNSKKLQSFPRAININKSKICNI